MRLFRIFFYLLMLTSLTNCSKLVGRRMTAHTHAPFEGKVSPVQLKGIYFKVDPKDGHYCRLPWAFYLFADGSVSASVTSQTSKEVADEAFWSNPEVFVRTMDWGSRSNEEGHYFIENNRFTMELTYIMPSTPFRNFIRFEGGISSDSTICFDSKKDTWCEHPTPKGGKFNFERVHYKIYHTDVRPDSTDMWFKETAWYKENVWHNQQ
jgi:hypothetical protein